jgi:hypothetical protein
MGDGEIDGIYKLEESRSYYDTLLAHCPTVELNTTIDPIVKVTLCNEPQEDLPVIGGNDKEMLWIVDNHHHELNIDDSKEMMVDDIA